MNEEQEVLEERMPEPMDERISNIRNLISNQPEQVEVPRRTKQDLLREYEIKLSFLNRGCIVKIGCKSIAFETNEKALKEITRYVNDPIKVYDEWMKVFNEE